MIQVHSFQLRLYIYRSKLLLLSRIKYLTSYSSIERELQCVQTPKKCCCPYAPCLPSFERPFQGVPRMWKDQIVNSLLGCARHCRNAPHCCRHFVNALNSCFHKVNCMQFALASMQMLNTNQILRQVGILDQTLIINEFQSFLKILEALLIYSQD